MINLDNPVLQILEDCQVAMFRKAVDTFIALHEEDVLVFDRCGVWSYKGIASWRQQGKRHDTLSSIVACRTP